jgi:assimilatory nitrate reductase catalytic subunit
MDVRETRSTCPYCGVGCGVIIQSEHDGAAERIVGVQGDPDHPANFGRLCTKGATLHLTATPAVIDTSRLLRPRLRTSRHEALRDVAWDQAIDTVATRIADVVTTHGPDAVGLYISGQLLTEDYYVFNKLAKGLIGTNNIDTNSRLCMSSAVAGYKQSLGADAPPCSYEDLNHADCVFITGSNMAWAHPVLFRRLEDARAARPSMRIVVVDPRRTETAEFADLHLAIQPGTDVALCHGMLHAIIWDDLIARDFIAQHTEGFEALKALVRDMTPQHAASLCGIKVEDLLQAARWFAESKATLSLYCQGLNQSTSGTAKNTALINLHLATAQIGRPGAGPFSLTGQPNAMGGREVGGMANLLSAHRDLANPEHRREVAELWGVDDVPATPGKTAVEMFEAAARGEIQVLWIACTNPAQSMPDQTLVRAALERCPFVIVQDAFAHTETTAYADVLLPASTWGEKEGTVTNSERRISRVRSAVSAPGEARHDWRIAVDIGRALQRRLASSVPACPTRPDLLAYDDVESVWNEHRESTRGRDLDITGLSYTILDAQGPQQWPMPEGQAAGRARLYEDSHFATPTGRARFITKPYTAPADARTPAFPFALTTTRLRDQWHGMSRSGAVARLYAHEEVPVLRLHPIDMQRRSLTPGALVTVSSRRGKLVLPVKADDRVGRSQADMAMHWGSHFLGGRGDDTSGSSRGGVNALTTSAFCPDSKQPELKHCAVSVKPAVLPWRLMVARWFDDEAEASAVRQQLQALMLRFDHASCVPVAASARVEASGAATQQDSVRQGLRFEAACAQPFEQALLDQLIAIAEPAGSTMPARYDDLRGHRARRLWIQGAGTEATLRALCVAGPEGEGAWLLDLWRYRAAVAPYGRELLSPQATQPRGLVIEADPQICNCFDIKQGRIVKALKTVQGDAGQRLRGLQSQLQCGTQCGSCLPTLRRLVQDTAPEVQLLSAEAGA